MRGFDFRFIISDDLNIFQFTPLREGLPQVHLIPKTAAYFNSRPCVRVFAAAEAAGAYVLGISIHAPA